MSDTKRTFSEQQMKMLSDIFRVVIKEIKTDDDKEKLAPGELGISYQEGSFYIRDPYTGELFCPNSIAHVQQILSKFNPITNVLNADTINSVKMYTSLTQLSQIGISLSADTVIRQMEMPSILFSPVEYTNYTALGFPSELGMVMIIKLSESFVMAFYYDYTENKTFDGIYNHQTHMLEGWSSRKTDTTYAETVNSGDHINVIGPVIDNLSDMATITVRVTGTINPGADLSYNGSPYYPISLPSGDPLPYEIGPNNTIVLIYNGQQDSWVYNSPTVDTQSTINSIFTKRIDDLNVLVKSMIDAIGFEVDKN